MGRKKFIQLLLYSKRFIIDNGRGMCQIDQWLQAAELVPLKHVDIEPKPTLSYSISEFEGAHM